MVETFRLWPFPINWRDGFELTLELRTEVITSEEGDEQRNALRATPRKSFRFTNSVRETKFRKFLTQMTAWQARATICPEFSSYARMSNAAPNGQDYIVVDSVPAWLVDGTLVCFLYGDEAIYREVLSVVSNTITFTEVLVGDWPEGLKVFKGVKGRIANQMSVAQHTNNALSIGVTFDADPGVETWPSVGSASVSHRSREVLLKRPNWRGGLEPAFQAQQMILDYGVGRTQAFNDILFNDRVHKANYVGKTIADVEDAINFFRRVKGQQIEFYMPTWTEDLVIKQTISAGSNQMLIAGTETAEDLVADTIYKDLIVFLEDGTYLMRTVSSIFVSGDDTIIQVSAAFPNQIEPANVRQICWMPLWRFATDQITFKFLTDEVAEYAMTMKTLEYEDAE